MDFSTSGNIHIRADTDLWGAYLFSFPPCSSLSSNDGAIPHGATITSVQVKAYKGLIYPEKTLSEETEITDLVDPSYTPQVVDDTKVSIKFQYPVAISYKGEVATLVFKLTLSSGAVYPFFFQYVKID